MRCPIDKYGHKAIGPSVKSLISEYNSDGNTVKVVWASVSKRKNSFSELTHATVATGENFEVFRDTFLTLLQRGLMSYTCNSSSPFVKVSRKRQKSVTKDFEIFPSGNGSVRLAVIRRALLKDSTTIMQYSTTLRVNRHRSAFCNQKGTKINGDLCHTIGETNKDNTENQIVL